MVKVEAVFSREGNPERRYVQDAIIQRADDVWDLIEQRANIYVCGNANTMAPAVRTALIEVFRLKSRNPDRRQHLARRLARRRSVPGRHLGRLKIMAEPPITQPRAPPPPTPPPAPDGRAKARAASPPR